MNFEQKLETYKSLGWTEREALFLITNEGSDLIRNFMVDWIMNMEYSYISRKPEINICKGDWIRERVKAAYVERNKTQ